MYESVQEIKRKNRQGGGRFFERGTMDFFNSRIESSVIGERYFVTSEQFCDRNGDCAERLYTVRAADDSGAIHTVGGFQQHATQEEAIAAAVAADRVGK